MDEIAPLIDQLKQGVKLGWMEVEQKSFEDIKYTLYESLKFSPSNYGKPLCLQIDVSEIGAGAVLFQRGKNPEKDGLSPLQSKSLVIRRNGTPW